MGRFLGAGAGVTGVCRQRERERVEGIVPRKVMMGQLLLHCCWVKNKSVVDTYAAVGG